ncbi:hypothetical protein [Glaesserella parasuis]|nr:hypothetical protein [Glaesserella parasuis]MDG6449032.1 hypothetical protein [Glaesserella parasuis]MDG6475197.1 hypothetical protein [Glaesserella parasuis]
MLEVISKDATARRFAYIVVILSFIFGMAWVLPNLINAIRG